MLLLPRKNRREQLILQAGASRKPSKTIGRRLPKRLGVVLRGRAETNAQNADTDKDACTVKIETKSGVARVPNRFL